MGFSDLQELERKRLNAELEARIRQAGWSYEKYLLADAYAHAAMRRRTRAEAANILKSNGKKPAC